MDFGYCVNVLRWDLDATEEAKVMTLLARDEVARIGRFHFDIDRKVSLPQAALISLMLRALCTRAVCTFCKCSRIALTPPLNHSTARAGRTNVDTPRCCAGDRSVVEWDGALTLTRRKAVSRGGAARVAALQL